MLKAIERLETKVIRKYGFENPITIVVFKVLEPLQKALDNK